MLEEFGNKMQKDAGTTECNKEPKEDCEAPRRRECGTEEGKEEAKLKRNQWSIVASGKHVASSLTIKQLQPGVYYFAESNVGILLCRSPINTDELIAFPDSLFDDVEKEVDRFWETGDSFQKYGFLHRRGYLFYGPAGSGKSCLVQRIIKNVIEKDGLVFLCSGPPHLASLGLQIFREVEPDRKIVCVFEDIDAITHHYGESEVLMLLDGENQVDKVVNIATTNYPERLDKRIVARPRRFDKIIKIGMPNEKVRRVYFKEKLKIYGEGLDKWITDSEGLSFASLSELVISVKCFQNDFDDTIKRLRELTNVKYSSAEFDNGKLGF